MTMPARTALLVVDLQNDFCAEGGYIENVVGRSTAACRAILPAVDELIDAARAAKIPVIWAVADYTHDRIPLGQRARLKNSTDVCCAPGSWGADFAGPRPTPGETVIVKHSYSAFHETSMEDELRRRKIETLVIAGVQTNVCVECCIRDGFVRGFYIVVPEDCVASHTPDAHAATLSTTRTLFGDVVPSGRLIARWANR